MAAADPRLVHVDRPGLGFVVGLEEGQRIDLPGWSMKVKVKADDTQGRFAVVSGQIGPGVRGAAGHIHQRHDETFIVLEGRLRFRLGDAFQTAVAGETVFAGRHLAHGFGNPFDEAASYVVVLTPSGYEDYFAKFAAHLRRCGTPPGDDDTRALMAEHDTVIAAALADNGQR